MAEAGMGALSRRVADGETVDWDAAAGGGRVDRGFLEALQLIERLSRAHREAAELLGPSRGSGSHERWGHLDILEEIGSGSYGKVYRARDRLLDREVALKLLDEPNLEEGRLLARLRHPNIVTIHGYDVQDGRAGLWMELVEGRDLAEIVRTEGPLEIEEAVETAIEVCEALATVHSAGILHRDVKAQNVMREADGRIVLTDFGIGQRASEVVAAREVSGTPVYLAPEVLNAGPPSARSEVYSLGVLVFFLLTGRFPVEADSLEGLLRGHREGLSNRLRDLRPDLPIPLVKTIERAIATDPKARYATVGRLGEALARVLPAKGSRTAVPAISMSRRSRHATGGFAIVGLALLWAFVDPLSRIEKTDAVSSEVSPSGMEPSAAGHDLAGSILDMAHFGGKSYLLVGAPDGTGINWTDSEAFARSLGGHLVTIDSQAEQDFLADRWGDEPDTPNSPYALWIGLRDADGSNVFDVWEDGTPLGYSHFHPREPDQDTEDYIAMMVDWGGCGKSSAGNPWFNTPNHTSNSCGLGKHYYGIVELPTAATRTAPPGIVGWWPGDGGGRDLVGTNHAALQGATIAPVGKVGSAFRFESGEGRLEIPDHESLRLQLFTIEGWFYLVSDRPRTLVGKSLSDSELSSFAIRIDDGIRFEASNGEALTLSVHSRVMPPLERYIHLAVTWDGDSGKLYLDGDFLAALDPADFRLGYSDTPILVTAGPAGRIDELTIFDRALSRREVSKIHARGSDGKWRDLDGDGVADADDRCPESRVGEPVDATGCI